MPIKPENKARYPKDWPEIRQCMLLRAKDHCEWHDCKAHNGDRGTWEAGEWIKFSGPDSWRLTDLDGNPRRMTRIVLTIAHLDHTPENCEPSNLRALCQRHHLAYDQRHHLETAYATRKARACTADMFGA